MKAAQDVRMPVSMIFIVMLFIFPLISENATANLAGDENQLPNNETMLDLNGGTTQSTLPGASSDYCYHKNNTFVWGIYGGIYNGKMFDGTHQMGLVGGTSNFAVLLFPNPLKITRIRVYPMGDNNEMNANKIDICKPLSTWKTNNIREFEKYTLSSSNTNNIQQKTDYVEVLFNHLITDCIAIGNSDQPNLKLNEIEIYYDKTFNPYPSPSDMRNYYNSTNITNEYYNESYVTYNNETFLNETYLNEIYNTYENETYLTKTYQNDTYTGTYTDITYRNSTYQNITNQTGGALFQNISKEFINYTYLNETDIQNNKQLEEKLNWVMNRLNETEKSTVTESKSIVDSPYTNPFLIILLLLIIVLQLIIVFRRKKEKVVRGTEADTTTTLQPEIEHTPKRGFTKEEESPILRQGANASPPSLKEAPMLSLPYPQYQQRNTQVQPTQRQPSSLTEDFNARVMKYQPTPELTETDSIINLIQEKPAPQPPTIVEPTDSEPFVQKALPEARLPETKVSENPYENLDVKQT